MVTNHLSKRILIIRKYHLFEFHIVMNIPTLRVLSLSNSILHTHHPQENNSEAEHYSTIDVVWINYDTTHVLRVFTQSTWSKFQDIYRVYFLEWLADKFPQGGDRGQAELFLSKDDCIDIRKARTWSNLSHAGNRYGVSLVNFALLELCPSAWYRLSSYAPYS